MELLILFVAAGMTIGTFLSVFRWPLKLRLKMRTRQCRGFWFGELFQTGANAFGA